MAEDESDVDGFLLEQLRSVLGPDVPIVATLDLHAHLTLRMARLADVFVAYHSNPHIDRRGTGRRAGHVLWRILGGAKPKLSFIRLPMLVSGEANATTSSTLAPVFKCVRELESREEILSSAILMSQPLIDTDGLGWTVMIFTDDQAQLGGEKANELAEMCWDRHEQLRSEFLDASESVLEALAFNGKPVIIADGADATNSGACGDSTYLLREMIKQPIADGALTIMVDPEAVGYARTVGVSGAFRFAVGGKRDNVFSKPLSVSGKVLSLQRARYVLSGHLGDNLRIDMGNAAVVKINDVTLLLVERSGPGSSPMMYRCVGLEPKDYKMVVVKSPAGFRAEFEPFAAKIILSACPGCASANLEELPYKNLSRPVWPLDEIDDWRSVDWIDKINKQGIG